MKQGEPLRKACDEDPTAKQIIDVAQGLEGSCATPRSTPPRW